MTQPSARSVDQSQDGSTRQTTSRPVRRTLQRRSFEFYVDQLETLKSWSLQAQLLGEKTSMSEMIRSALDSYLGTHQPSTSQTDDSTSRPTDSSVGGGAE